MVENIQCAAILAGGRSSRMKREKALIEIEGETLIERTSKTLRTLFPQIVVVTFNSEVAEKSGVEAITDQYPDCGPIGGIHAALQHFGKNTFILACDMPFLSPNFIEEMARSFSGDALIPRHENGIEPLHGIYAPSCLSIFEKFLISEQKIPSFSAILTEVNAIYISAPIGLNFENWNRPSDIR